MKNSRKFWKSVEIWILLKLKHSSLDSSRIRQFAILVDELAASCICTDGRGIFRSSSTPLSSWTRELALCVLFCRRSERKYSEVAGTDYEEASGTITFGVGEDTKNITIKPIDDDINEPDKDCYIDLTLGAENPGSVRLGPLARSRAASVAIKYVFARAVQVHKRTLKHILLSMMSKLAIGR